MIESFRAGPPAHLGNIGTAPVSRSQKGVIDSALAQTFRRYANRCRNELEGNGSNLATCNQINYRSFSSHVSILIKKVNHGALCSPDLLLDLMTIRARLTLPPYNAPTLNLFEFTHEKGSIDKIISYVLRAKSVKILGGIAVPARRLTNPFDIARLWQEGHIQLVKKREGLFAPDVHLCISPALIPYLTEALFAQICSSPALQDVTHFDLGAFPQLGREAPIILFRACPKIDRSCFRPVLEQMRFQDAQFCSIPVNKAIITAFLPRCNLENGSCTVDARRVRALLLALHGAYEVESENNTEILASIVALASNWGAVKIAETAARRLYSLYKTHTPLGFKEVSDLTKAIWPYLAGSPIVSLVQQASRKCIQEFYEPNKKKMLAMLEYISGELFNERHARCALQQGLLLFNLTAEILNIIKEFQPFLVDLSDIERIDFPKIATSLSRHSSQLPFPKSLEETCDLLLKVHGESGKIFLTLAYLYNQNWKDRGINKAAALGCILRAYSLMPHDIPTFVLLCELLPTPKQSLFLLEEKMALNPSHPTYYLLYASLLPQEACLSFLQKFDPGSSLELAVMQHQLFKGVSADQIRAYFGFRLMSARLGGAIIDTCWEGYGALIRACKAYKSYYFNEHHYVVPEIVFAQALHDAPHQGTLALVLEVLSQMPVAIQQKAHRLAQTYIDPAPFIALHQALTA